MSGTVLAPVLADGLDEVGVVVAADLAEDRAPEPFARLERRIIGNRLAGDQFAMPDQAPHRVAGLSVLDGLPGLELRDPDFSAHDPPIDSSPGRPIPGIIHPRPRSASAARCGGTAGRSGAPRLGRTGGAYRRPSGAW